MSKSEPAPLPTGAVHPRFDGGPLRKWLAHLPDAPGLEPAGPFRPNVYRAPPPASGLPPLSLRFFGKDAGADAAKAAFENGLWLEERGISTPAPLAWLPGGNAAPGGILVAEAIPGAITFREALLHHYHEQPLCRLLMRLLEVTADAIAAMHRAGCEHRALGPQHLLALRDEDGCWKQAWITGLHRARTPGSLTPAQRGRDNARLRLPSDLRRVFHEMQFAPETVPAEFQKAEARARRRWAHTHPPDPRVEPREKDVWIWDDRSMQAIPALRGSDKRKHYRRADALAIAASLARHGPKLRKARDTLLAEAWTRPVPLAGKLGLSLNLEPERFEKERRWLTPLGPLPLLVRLYHHESESRRRYAIEAVRKLCAEGHRVTVALVQDRRAVLYPRKWADFVDNAGAALSGFAEAVEFGHAVNRVKWGLWDFEEYRALARPLENWADRFPQLPLWGPAGIDFEYHRVLPLLDRLPAGARWSALSHHLYVDRRGAPENEQSGYDTLRKLALARAMARVHPACEDRLVVSEVNWPLKGTGVWSPVGSPWESPGPRHNDPSVDEDTYAAYMARYLLIALCSGMADRVYWWNLAAHGFGLIDDRDPAGWRPRPAYNLFKSLVTCFRDSEYLERLPSEPRKYHLRLQKNDGTPFQIDWDADSIAPPTSSVPWGDAPRNG